jgi:hypothetical protein
MRVHLRDFLALPAWFASSNFGICSSNFWVVCSKQQEKGDDDDGGRNGIGRKSTSKKNPSQ